MSDLLMLQGDARQLPLADGSVQTIVTSPPYWGLRDYGNAPAVWGGDPDCDHAWGPLLPPAQPGPGNATGAFSTSSLTNPARQNSMVRGGDSGRHCECGGWVGCLGLEPTPDLFVEHMVEIGRELRRVLRDNGTLWLNLGDSYVHGGNGARDAGRWPKQARNAHGFRSVHAKANVPGLKPKDLVGIPWEVALALRRDGWWLRSDIIWSKPNPMPESVTDRPTKAHEYLFLLTKAEHYFYDADAIREPVAGTAHSRGNGVHPKSAPAGSGIKANESFSAAIKDLVDERNKRSVWEIATQPYPGSHFATFPSALTEPCILAGSAKGDWVLDPFAGSGTTALVALEHQRRAILVDINHPYLQDLAAGRLMRVARVPVVDHKPEGALL